MKKEFCLINKKLSDAINDNKAAIIAIKTDTVFNIKVLSNNDNWIEYGDLLYQTTENVRDLIPEIDIDTVEKWIKKCIENEYISVAKSQKDEITADDYCRGEWLGLDKE